VLVKGKGGSVALSELRRAGGKNILIASNDGSEAAPVVVVKAETRRALPDALDDLDWMAP